MKLPPVLFVRVDGDDEYFVAESGAADCIVDDGPTAVGVYQLVETRTLAKRSRNSSVCGLS